MLGLSSAAPVVLLGVAGAALPACMGGSHRSQRENGPPRVPGPGLVKRERSVGAVVPQLRCDPAQCALLSGQLPGPSTSQMSSGLSCLWSAEWPLCSVMLLPGRGGRGRCGPGSLRCRGLVVLFHLGIPDRSPTAGFCCMLSFALSSQGDDGPDVRGGSGDILLVHATETDRKGAATPWAGALVLVTALGVGWPHRPRGGGSERGPGDPQSLCREPTPGDGTSPLRVHPPWVKANADPPGAAESELQGQSSAPRVTTRPILFTFQQRVGVAVSTFPAV